MARYFKKERTVKSSQGKTIVCHALTGYEASRPEEKNRPILVELLCHHLSDEFRKRSMSADEQDIDCKTRDPTIN